MEQPKNRGLILDPLIPNVDYVFGGYSKLKGEMVNPSGDWLPYIPTFEHQAPRFETYACISHGLANAIEILHKKKYGGALNLSDRFIAKGSDTNPQAGNSPKKVAHFFRKNWSVQEDRWPMEGVNSSAEYYKEIPTNLREEAKRLKGRHIFGYEFVNPSPANLRLALTKGVVGFSAALAIDTDGLYYKPNGWHDVHWMTMLQIRPNGNYVALDSYPPFIKEIRADFVSEFAHRYELDTKALSDITRLIEEIRRWLGI